MSITVFLGNVQPAEVDKPFKDVGPDDPNLLEKASILKTVNAEGEVTYDPAEEIKDNPEMVAARLNAYTTAKAIEGLPHNKAITTVTTAAMDPLEAFNELKPVLGIHFLDGALPVWVESNDPDMAALLSRRYECPVGRPEDWDDPTKPFKAPKAAKTTSEEK